MVWLAAKQGDNDEARRLFLEAGKSLAVVRAWLNLITVLGNLSAIPIDGALGFLAQAVWLSVRVETPAEDALNLSAVMLQQLGIGHEIGPLLGATAAFIAQTRGQNHPEREKLVQYGFDRLSACAVARKIEQQDQFEQWFVDEGLNDPNRFLPALSSALEAMVGEGKWLFDRRLVGEP